MSKQVDWFENWFDSPFYHILYKERGCLEAELFIDKLISFLNPNKDASFVDVGCGKGRHAIYLNKKGFDVTGIDLSENSIKEANKSTNSRLQFHVHDMRKEFQKNHFNYALNLFTSFGYFENEQDNYDAIKAISDSLKPSGIIVVDFMNSPLIIKNIIPEEKKIIESIEFIITKKIENDFIVKTITFSCGEKNYVFHEKVRALKLDNFKKYFEANQLKIVHLKGNYNLDDFNENTSDRLILIAKKE